MNRPTARRVARCLAALICLLTIASAGFATPVTSGLALWLDASDPLGFPSGSSPIAQWADRSGNTNGALQPNGSQQPVLVPGALGGMPAVRFDGVDDVLDIDTALSVARDYTIFIVDQYYSAAVTGRTLQSASANWLMGKWGGNNAHYGGTGFVASRGATVGVPVIGEAVGELANFNHYYIDGEVAGRLAQTHVPGNMTLGGAVVPATNPPYNEPSTSDVAEVLVYNRLLTKVEHHQVGEYLATKYGIANEYNPAGTVYANHGGVSTFNGADPGEGLDLTGNLVHAVNLGGDSVVVGGRTFHADAIAPGVTVSANNVIDNWATRPDYDTGAADDDLERVLHDIRYSATEQPIDDVTVTMDVTPGELYQLQVLFSENIGTNVRQMEVQVEGMHQLDATNNIVSDGANVNSHGTVFTHTFVAAGPTAEVVIDGAYLQQRDIFPAVNAVTLESLTEPAAAPHSGTTTLGAFTGGEVGEGLDLDGTFLYAVNVGGPDTPTIRDVTFDSNNTGAAPYAIDTPPGVGIWALNHIPGWYATVDYGAAPEDDALESMMDDIRWSNNPDTVSVVLEELTVGQAYKLQLLFDEAATAPNRSFDVFVEGQLAIDNLNTGTSLDGTGVVMTHEFVATDDTLTVVLDGTRGNTSDLNPILQGFTLEVVPEPASLTLLLVGLIGLLRMRNRK